MLKNVAAVLLMISMSAGSAQARLLGSSSLTHAHFPTCSEGLVEINLCMPRRAWVSPSTAVSERPILPHL